VRAWFIGVMTLVPLGVLGASCALGSFDKIEPPVDAGIDLGCQHTTVPLPPNLTDADNGDAVSTGDVEFTAALRTLRMKRTADGGALGLDLDRYCSCQGEPPSCVPPPKQDPELSCDIAQGRDNQAIALFRIIESVLLFDPEGDELSELYSEFANLGRWSILMRVTGYNGLPNDDQVRVEWYPSGGMPSPTWSGNDAWPVVPSAISDAGVAPDGGPLARFADNDAYVTNGELVFSLIESEFTASNGLTQLSMTITDGTGTATIEKGPNGYYLRNGIIGGRLELSNVFKMAADFRDHNGVPFCANASNPYWNSTRDAFCRGLDIQVGSPQPSKKCDALSIGMGFEAEPAQIGPIEPAQSGQMNCPLGEDPLSVFIDSGCPQQQTFPSDASDAAMVDDASDASDAAAD
jgi:hypothetical protein